MSYTQKNLKSLINEIAEKQSRQAAELSQLQHIKSVFKESDKARDAKEVAFSKKLDELRGRFSNFFNQQSKGNGGAV